MFEKFLIFVFTMVAEILLGVGLVISVLYPNHRLWPPPKRTSWQFWYIWTLFITSTLGVILLGIIDNNTLSLSHSVFPVTGIILIAIGSFIELWGVMILSFHASLGLDGKLVTTGPYRYSRNPQCLGFIVAIVGVILLANSVLAFITGVIGILLFALTPFAEEPWLRKRFKKEYDEYCKKVPRFL